MARQPLALRMRPKTVDDVVGQSHILNPDSLLYKMIKNDTLSSVILYGPPGTGKTTIAQVIANITSADFRRVNAVSSGKKDIEAVCSDARKSQEKDPDARTVLFIDEIHRFNKAQQDYLLPFVEDGTVVLIGATTENPFFEVNPAIISRSTVFELKPVTAEDLKGLVLKALADKEDGLGGSGLSIGDTALAMLADQANGDCRNALNILELAATNASGPEITEEDVKAVISKPHLRYDKDGDMHYDIISAFIKSMRGSDPDAVLYWLARMIEAGEDPKFIARRIMVHASEDVGNADPMALVVATAASLAAERVGFPEARIILSQAALYVAMAPKCNTSCAGIAAAADYVAAHPSDDVPAHLRDSHYKSAKKLGRGIGYLYPHDFPRHWVPQQYLPDAVRGHVFYRNSHVGYEQAQADYQNGIRSEAAKDARIEELHRQDGTAEV